MRKHHLTPRSRAHLAEWRDMWIARAMSTEPMSPEECAIATDAVRGLYGAANLPAPTVVMAGGPISATIAAGIAAAVWYLREHPEEHVEMCGRQMSEDDLMYVASLACALAVAAAHDALAGAPMETPATLEATLEATLDATREQTQDAALDATRAATEDAALDATLDATRDVTRTATMAVTLAATINATRDGRQHVVVWDETMDATRAATEDAAWAAARDATRDSVWADSRIPPLFRACIKAAYGSMADGGNFGPGRPSFVSFFRHVAGLKLDYAHWDHYERLAIHSGPRLMHRRFCVVSDRPTVLLVDEQRRPHCADGPSHVWRDGVRLYHWHGVRVPAQWIEAKDTVDPRLVLSWSNVEQRRALAEILGWTRVLDVLAPRAIP